MYMLATQPASASQLALSGIKQQQGRNAGEKRKDYDPPAHAQVCDMLERQTRGLPGIRGAAAKRHWGEETLVVECAQ